MQNYTVSFNTFKPNSHNTYFMYWQKCHLCNCGCDQEDNEIQESQGAKFKKKQEN